VALTQIMEEAGHRIRRREERGPIDRVHGYAWVTVRSIALSRMRLGSSKLIRKRLTRRREAPDCWQRPYPEELLRKSSTAYCLVSYCGCSHVRNA
jgi:hypothetical protein